jgi:hypothetical protein
LPCCVIGGKFNESKEKIEFFLLEQELLLCGFEAFDINRFDGIGCWGIFNQKHGNI